MKKNWNGIFVALSALSLAFALTACGGDTGNNYDDDENNGGGGTAGEGQSCDGNGDCSGDLQCLGSTRTCVKTCADASECNGTQTCEPLNDSVGICTGDNGSNNANNAGNNANNANNANNTGNNANNTGNNANNTGNNANNANNTGNNANNTTPAGLTCSEIVSCINDAMCMDQACADNCIDQGSAAAMGQFNDVAACVQANCAMAPAAEQQACISQNCGDELMTCNGTPGNNNTGDLDCTGINQCVSDAACGPMDQACFANCIGMGTPEAQEDFNAINACGQANCAMEMGAEAINACINENCETEVTACFGDVEGFCLRPCTSNADCTAGEEMCADAGGRMECLTAQGGIPPGNATCSATMPCVEPYDPGVCFFVQ